MPLFLAIDLGTTGCRSILFDESLRELSDSYMEYALATPRAKWAEQDASVWWELTKQTMREAVRRSGRAPSEIDGISISSQGITIVPVDSDIRPLHAALSWLDVRAERQADALRRAFGSLFPLTGKQIDPVYSLPKILWIRENLPEVYQKTWKFLMPMDFLTAKLTGKCVTDHSMASGTLLYDLGRHCWSETILERCGIREELLPELRWSGQTAGTVLPDVADELGLRRDCVVAVGAQDQKCAAFGAGLRPGVITVSLGTSAAVSMLHPRWDAAGSQRIGWCGYVREGAWVTEGVINTAGVCLRWVRDTVFPGEGYDVINREAAEARAQGCGLLFYPYLSGPGSPDYYPESTGCFYGLTLADRRGGLALAVMEGVAFQLRVILEAMGAYENPQTLVLFGGGANSPFWCQTIADITGLRIAVPESAEAAGAGAAALAGIAAGAFSRAGPPRMRRKAEYVPGERRQDYEKAYRKYREIEKRLWNGAERTGV